MLCIYCRLGLSVRPAVRDLSSCPHSNPLEEETQAPFPNEGTEALQGKALAYGHREQATEPGFYTKNVWFKAFYSFPKEAGGLYFLLH